MLGWPLNDESFDYDVTVSQERLSDEGKYAIFRISFKIMDEITMTGLLLKYNDDEKRPFVISQHGGLGTPELIAGVYGDTCNYNEMTQRILSLGANVFAPQLLLWQQEDYGVDYDRIAIDAKLKRVGSSITAIEIFGITKIIDYFEKTGLCYKYRNDRIVLRRILYVIYVSRRYQNKIGNFLLIL